MKSFTVLSLGFAAMASARTFQPRQAYYPPIDSSSSAATDVAPTAAADAIAPAVRFPENPLSKLSSVTSAPLTNTMPTNAVFQNSTFCLNSCTRSTTSFGSTTTIESTIESTPTSQSTPTIESTPTSQSTPTIESTPTSQSTLAAQSSPLIRNPQVLVPAFNFTIPGNSTNSTSTLLRPLKLVPALSTPTATPDSGSTTLTVIATQTRTVVSCAATVTDCPARVTQTGADDVDDSARSTFVVTDTVILTTTVCPVDSASSISSSVVGAHSNGLITGSTIQPTSTAPAQQPAQATSTVSPTASAPPTDSTPEDCDTPEISAPEDSTVPEDSSTDSDTSSSTTITSTLTATQTLTVQRSTVAPDITPPVAENCDASTATVTVTLPVSTVFVTMTPATPVDNAPTLAANVDEPEATNEPTDCDGGELDASEPAASATPTSTGSDASQPSPTAGDESNTDAPQSTAILDIPNGDDDCDDEE